MSGSFVLKLHKFVVMNKYIILIVLIALHTHIGYAQTNASAYSNLAPIDQLKNRWSISDKGEITWYINDSSSVGHTDHVEMSGLRVAGIIKYGMDDVGDLILERKVVWPMLRTIPNDTHASLTHTFKYTKDPNLFIQDSPSSTEKLVKVQFNGILSISSLVDEALEVKRDIFPSTTKPAMIETITITNKAESVRKVRLSSFTHSQRTASKDGVYGSYRISAECGGIPTCELKPNESVKTTIVYLARRRGMNICVDGTKEKDARWHYVNRLFNTLCLETPDTIINEMFRLAKVRAAESIFATKGGLMHGPGGGHYYAAIWANDQAEYINPFFPFLGDNNGNQSAINSFQHFGRYINSEYNPLPSSIIAEGTDIWNGAGDRGDAAMLAYGASRFALAYGRKETAKALLPLIKWCLSYCEVKLLPEGVVASDSDELEGRFPAGKANLSTNMLTYGAYRSAAFLLNALNQDSALATHYRQASEHLRLNCDQYFGGEVMGFNTYKYFESNEKLRSWICLPLTMGIFDRKDETLKALFSPLLWNKSGIYTEVGNETFWDRSTLYAFKGIFYAGETDLALQYFHYYSQKRLLGNHVPYAIEAWPEGGQRHLSAESGLYCRVITEGLFGIEPTGFKSFTCTPKLPTKWNYMQIKNIKAFQSSFDLNVKRVGAKTLVSLIEGDRIIAQKYFDGNNKLEFILP